MARGFSQYSECQGSVPSLRKFQPTCRLSLTALQKKRDWWTSLYIHRELNSIWWIWWHIHHYRLAVNKSTRAFVKNIVNYVAHFFGSHRQIKILSVIGRLPASLNTYLHTVHAHNLPMHSLIFSGVLQQYSAVLRQCMFICFGGLALK